MDETTATQNETMDGDGITDHREMLDIVTAILEEAQHTRPKSKMVKRMQAARLKCHKKNFPRILFRAMVMAFNGKEKSPYITNLLNFFYRCVVEIEKSEAQAGAKRSESFLEVIIKCCCKYHCDDRAHVRSHIFHLVSRLLDSLPVCNAIDEKILSKLREMVVAGTRDRSSQVRAYASCALKHFQEPDFAKCRVTKILIQRTKYDPSSDVRRASLKSMNVNEKTVEFIVERVRDTNELVRLTAQANIADKLSVNDITVDNREMILDFGLSGKVSNQALLVVEKWLASHDSNVITLLSTLDVINNKKVCYLTLENIFKEATTKYFELVDMTLWGEKKLIPIEKLNEEVAFYWKYVVAKFSNIPFCADLLIPEVNELCEYLRSYMNDYGEMYVETHGVSVLGELLEVLLVASVRCEEGGRREISGFIRTAFQFEHLDVTHVKVLMELLYIVESEEVDDEFFDIIQSLQEVSRPAREQDTVVAGTTIEPDIPSGPTEQDKMQMKLEVANLIHERHKLIREKDQAVGKQQFLEAHELQQKIDDLKERAESIRRRMSEAEDTKSRAEATGSGDQNKEALGSRNVSRHEASRLANQSREEEAMIIDEPEVEPPKPADYPADVLEIVLAAFSDHILRQKEISVTARSFHEDFVSKAVFCHSTAVRQLVIRCHALFGLTNETDARRSMLYCIQALVYDDEEVQYAAYRGMFDLILEYGFEFFNDHKVQQVVSHKDSIKDLSSSLLEDNVPTLKMLILDRLSSENPKLVKIGAIGVMKLSLAKRMTSVKIVVRLLLMWCNPLHENTKLMRKIAKWLPLFTKMGIRQALLVAEALVPTLRKIAYAGSNSPLADASPESLFALVQSATNKEMLELTVKDAEVQGKIAENVLDALLSIGPCSEAAMFAKALKFCAVRGMNGKNIRSLLKKVARLLKMNNNKVVNVCLSAFMKYLNAELLMVEDKQVQPGDTESDPETTGDNESDSEGSVHISGRSSPNLAPLDLDEAEEDMDEEEDMETSGN